MQSYTNQIVFSLSGALSDVVPSPRPSVTTLRHLSHTTRNPDNTLHDVERLKQHGIGRSPDRTFRPSFMRVILTEATLETQLHSRHRPRNRDATDSVFWIQKEGPTNSQQSNKWTPKQNVDLVDRQNRSVPHNHTECGEGQPVNVETHFCEALLKDSRQYDFWSAKSFQPQASVEYCSLFAFCFRRCSTGKEAVDAEA